MKLGKHIDWFYFEDSLFKSHFTPRREVLDRVMEYVNNKDRMSTQRRLMLDMDSWLDNEFELTFKI